MKHSHGATPAQDLYGGHDCSLDIFFMVPSFSSKTFEVRLDACVLENIRGCSHSSVLKINSGAVTGKPYMCEIPDATNDCPAAACQEAGMLTQMLWARAETLGQGAAPKSLTSQGARLGPKEGQCWRSPIKQAAEQPRDWLGASAFLHFLNFPKDKNHLECLFGKYSQAPAQTQESIFDEVETD